MARAITVAVNGVYQQINHDFVTKGHSIRLSGHLWEYTDEYQQRFENNSKLVKFTKGQG